MINRRGFMAAGAAVTVAMASTRVDPAKRIAALAEDARREMGAPGLAYGTVQDGRVSLRRGLGIRRLGEGANTGPRTLFHMASVTKPFVATAIAQRVATGRLRLNQRLGEALPEWHPEDARARSITIEQVLTHSSGLPDVEDYGWDRPETDAGALRRYVANLSGLRLLFTPGERFAYSNIGFELLARVIEVVDKTSFEVALRRTILAPLRMNRSTLFYPEADRADLASPHVRDGDRGVKVSDVFPYNRPHAGSSTLISCIDDMLRWVQVNLADGELDGVRIMSPETARDLRTPRPVEASGKSVPHGTKLALSWFVIPRPGGDIVAHGGLDLGFASLCLFCPQQRSGLVTMANYSDERGTDSLLRFALAAFDEGLLR